MRSIPSQRRVPGRLGLLALLLAVAPGCQPDAKPAPVTTFDAEVLTARLEAIADHAASQRYVPGVTMRVEMPCFDYVFETARGFADPDADEAMTPEHAYWTASVTKVITAATALRLVEQGRLQLEDTIALHLPSELVSRVHVVDGVSRGHEITVRQLLSHTSGLWDHASDPAFFVAVAWQAGKTWTPLELLEWAIDNGDPVGPPGGQFHYSDFGYLLAGLVIEAAYGGPLHEAYRELVFDPLGMAHSWLGGYENGPPETPVAHPFFAIFDIVGGLGLSPTFDWAGGGVISTNEDLARFFSGLFAGRLLTDESLQRMLEGVQPHLAHDLTGYAIRRPLPDAGDWRGHTGFWGTWTAHSPARNVTVTGSVSQSEADLREIQAMIFDAIPDLTCTEPGQRPIFEPGECPIEDPGPEGRPLECGRVRVPERRNGEPSRLVEIQTLVARTPAGLPLRPDPLVFLMGGPGGYAIDTILPFLPSAAFGVNLTGRDFVAFDQRGTGYSTPLLACELEIEPGNEDAFPPAMAACAHGFESEGIDPAAYHTRENARDADDVRRALGYETWNLYGVSYGTQLALDIMRLFPDRVRTATLDSPRPPQERFFEVYPRHAQEALDRLLDACAADAGCAARHPDLAERFERALRERAVKQPADAAGPAQIAEAIRRILYDTTSLPELPGALDAFANGDDATLLALFGGSDDFSRGDSEGMHQTIACREWAPVVSRKAMVKAHLDVGTPFALGILPRQQALYKTCRGWPSEPPDPSELEPVASDIPTLILVGEFDPVTPRANAELAARSLSNVQIIEFPGVGHAVVPSGTCPFVTTLGFLSDPVLPVRTDCVPLEYPGIEFAR